ncbi:LOW QUALITY PROTEIN: drebrin-like protein [Macrobrachium nipponense]|uniref:LOW QUALITY PROTEIN: drebrin-like protein n=1 Tax=Macrobrachium nipponense TaxID=159736 RepID=UPI0030C7E8A7
MSIDLDKNRNALLAAFNDVLNDKTKTDWALFGYEGQSNVLKVVGTGEDGIEELAEDLNSSKVMYAVVKVTDPNTTRPKVVLINWQGEGAPTLRKGTCARHLNDVNKFFRGVHVTVNARTEEEVETDVITAAVLKASATTYNFNERSEINDKTIPVQKPSGPAVTCGDGFQSYPSKMPKPKMKFDMGTNYKRTNPLAEIDTKSRNQFWEEQEAEERRRKTEEQQKRDEELKRLEVERKQREISDAKHREVLTKERNARILAERKAEDDAAKRLAAKDDKKWQEDLQSQYQEEQERAKRAEMMRLERKKEAESLIGHRTHSTRAMFETGNTTSEKNTELNRPPPRKLKEFKPTNTSERVENNDTPSVIPSKGVTARWPPANTTAQREDTSLNQNRDKVSPLSSVENRTRNQVSSTTVPSIIKQHPVEPMPQPPPQFQAPLPEVQPQPPSQPQSIQEPALHPQSNGDVRSNTYNDATVINKANQDHFQNDHSYDAMANAPSKASEVSDSAVQNNVVDVDPAINSTTPSIGMVYEVDGMEYQILPEHGLCARALYDYQAADDTEITFDPEEIITNIDQIDAGWWQGVGPDGSFGLFPANYVELINHSGV